MKRFQRTDNPAAFLSARPARFGRFILDRRFDSSGFTFLETLAALFVVMVGIASFYALINQTISYTKSSSYTLMAAYLGKEGIEIVKNIRDTNFLIINYATEEGPAWTDGLLGCEGGCQADYTSTSLQSYTDSYLKTSGTDPSRYLSYAAGTDTLFKRKITITPVGPGPAPNYDYLNVLVEITWSEKGRDHSQVVQENLFPWW